MLISTKLAVFGSIDFPDYFCQEIMAVFFNSCAQNRHDLLAKIVGKSMGPNAVSNDVTYKHWALTKTRILYHNVY